MGEEEKDWGQMGPGLCISHPVNKQYLTQQSKSSNSNVPCCTMAWNIKLKEGGNGGVLAINNAFSVF